MASADDSPEPKKLIIVDDHPAARAGISHYLGTEDGLEICGEAGSVAEAMSLVRDVDPDLVITDLSLPDRSGIDLIREMNANGHGDVPVLVISMHDESMQALRVVSAGGRGYLMKERASDLIVDVVWTLLRGGAYLSPAMTKRLESVVAMQKKNDEVIDPAVHLKGIELAIFQMLGQGRTNVEIAEHLQLSVESVEGHLTGIQARFDFDNHSTLVREAIRWAETHQVKDAQAFLKALRVTHSPKMSSEGSVDEVE